MVFLPNITIKAWLALIVVFASLCGMPSYAKESGTWKDQKTGLTWQRCSLGQTWNGYDCDGMPEKYTWDAAQQAAKAVGKGWRVPTVSELANLVRCNTGFQESVVIPNGKGGDKIMPNYCQKGDRKSVV